MNPASIEAAKVIAVAVLVLAGQWVVARYSKKANDKTAEVQQDANAVAGFHQLVGDLRTEVDRLRTEVGELRQHVLALEGERTRDRSLIRHLIGYVNVLIAALRTAGQPIPEAPGGLEFDGGALV